MFPVAARDSLGKVEIVDKLTQVPFVLLCPSYTNGKHDASLHPSAFAVVFVGGLG